MKRFALSLGLAFILVVQVAAFEPAPVSAYVYNPPWADVYGSQWNNLDTRGAAQDFVAYLDSGYTRWTDLNETASISIAYAQSDAIWVTFGHGGPGFITYCNPPNGSLCTTVLRSNIDCDHVDGVCMSDYGTTIHKVKLAVFAGCQTSRTPTTPSTARSLGDQAVNHSGVDSAIAFTDDIGFGGLFDPDHYWATAFAHRLSVGDTVNAAATVAYQNVEFYGFGLAQGWDTQYTWHGGTKVMPPAYGS